MMTRLTANRSEGAGPWLRREEEISEPSKPNERKAPLLLAVTVALVVVGVIAAVANAALLLEINMIGAVSGI